MSTYQKTRDYFKYFTTKFANGSNRPPATSGNAAAALISVGIGCFTMMISHHFAETSIAADTFIWGLGKWIPGSEVSDKLAGYIGSYTGKETIMLLSWLASWLMLHHLLKYKQVKSRTIFMWTFGLIVAATVMSWQPLFPYLPLM